MNQFQLCQLAHEASRSVATRVDVSAIGWLSRRYQAVNCNGDTGERVRHDLSRLQEPECEGASTATEWSSVRCEKVVHTTHLCRWASPPSPYRPSHTPPFQPPPSPSALFFRLRFQQCHNTAGELCRKQTGEASRFACCVHCQLTECNSKPVLRVKLTYRVRSRCRHVKKKNFVFWMYREILTYWYRHMTRMCKGKKNPEAIQRRNRARYYCRRYT